jgi:hypothetical protein
MNSALALDYIIAVPSEVKAGEWFNVNISLVPDEDINLTVYSYVFQGLNCVGQGWNINQKQVNLLANQQQDTALEDMVKLGTEEGLYKLRIKLKFDSTELNETYTLKVNAVNKSPIEETYLYAGLVIVSIIGLFIVIKYNR